MNRRRSITLALTACLLAGALAPAAGHHRDWHTRPKHNKHRKNKPKPKPPEPPSSCRDNTDAMRELAVPVTTASGGTAVAGGLYALPDEEPKGLVIFDHGYGHTSWSWTHHMNAAADRGLIAVTPDYRGIRISQDSNGDGLPESRGWDVMAGAQDTVAAAKYFDRRCATIDQIVVFGVSMGGNTAGLAVALAADERRPGGRPLFDHWVSVEAAVNVIETYLGARALAPVNEFAARAQNDIEREMGGPIEENSDQYLKRTVVARMDDIKASGVKSVTLVHGVDDGLVPYNQSRELAGLLAANAIPYDMFTVGRESDETDDDTSATGYVGGQIDEDYDSPIAGHASEKSRVHIVMTTAFDRLWRLFKGEEPGPANEYVVDGKEGTFPQ